MVLDPSLMWSKALEWINEYRPTDLFITLYKGRKPKIQGSIHVSDDIRLTHGKLKLEYRSSFMDINIVAPSYQLRELARQAVEYIYGYGQSFHNCQVINKAGSLAEFVTNINIHNNTRLKDALSMIRDLLLPFRNTGVYLGLGTRRDKDDIEVRGGSHIFTDGEVRLWSVHRHGNEFTFFYEVVPKPTYIIQVEPPTEEDEDVAITVRAPRDYWARIRRVVVGVVGRKNVAIGDLDEEERELEEQEEERIMKEIMREEEESRILPEWECGDEDEYSEE
mgnify:FL=1